jgi:hypothetical protein
MRQSSVAYLRMDGELAHPFCSTAIDFPTTWNLCTMAGGTKPEDRSVMIKDFNAPGSAYNVFMLRYTALKHVLRSNRFVIAKRDMMT